LPLWQTLQNNFSSRGKLQQPEIQCNTSVCFFATREPSDYVYILLTSDIHGHMKHSCRAHWCYPGAPSIATVAMRLSGEPFLLVDTGDSLFGASDLSETNVVKVMNRLGYHAMGLGNHDWDGKYNLPMIYSAVASVILIFDSSPTQWDQRDSKSLRSKQDFLF
jgi:hypothetical protein